MPVQPSAVVVSRPLRLIPVLDLAGGQVVRAVRGERSTYRAIRSRLAEGSDPARIAAALLDAVDAVGAPGDPRRGDAASDGAEDAEAATIATVATIYIADLDALQHGKPQTAAVSALLDALPQVEWWLDAGFESPAAATAALRAIGGTRRRIRPVYGSETPRSPQALEAIAADPGAILSLDVRDGRLLDPSGILHVAARWPPTVISMALDRVGSAAGPDLDRFSALRSRAPSRRWIGAGGIRDRGDLAAARAAGASAWLVASALHDRLLDDSCDHRAGTVGGRRRE